MIVEFHESFHPNREPSQHPERRDMRRRCTSVQKFKKFVHPRSTAAHPRVKNKKLRLAQRVSVDIALGTVLRAESPPVRITSSLIRRPPYIIWTVVQESAAEKEGQWMHEFIPRKHDIVSGFGARGRCHRALIMMYDTLCTIRPLYWKRKISEYRLKKSYQRYVLSSSATRL